ncbi:unnamed protein product, partial [marine sediment metagenome]
DECQCNENERDFPESEENTLSKIWIAKHDGSLSHKEEFDFNRCFEFITPILKTKKEFLQALKDFKENVCLNKPLKDVIAFNNSCGCHLHIGLDIDNKKFYKLLDYSILIDMRNLFFKLLKGSRKLSNETKEKVKSHYFRSYSKRLQKRSYLSVSIIS